VDPRSLVAIAVHLGEALLWALAYGYYVVSFYGPWKLLLLFLIWCHGCLVLFQAWLVHWLLLFLIWCHGCLVLFQAWLVHWLLLFLIWCHGCLVLFQTWVFAGLLFSYSIFVTGTKSALLALWQGYVSVAIMGTKSALLALWQLLSGASFSWGSLWQGWHWICAAFYGLQGVVLGTLPQLYGQGLFFFLNLCRVLFYAFRLLFGVPLSLFLLVSFGGAFGSGFYGLTRYLRARPLERLRKALSAPRKILIEKIYRKFIRCYLDTLFSHSLW